MLKKVEKGWGGGGGGRTVAPFLSAVVSSRFFFRVRISAFKQTRTRVDGAFVSIGGQSAELK